MPMQPERSAETFREKFIPRVVGWFCKRLGFRMLLLGIAKVGNVDGDPEHVEIKELRLIRSSGTQRFPNHPLTQALFAALMELQMKHLRELRAEVRSKADQVPTPTTPAPDRHVN
jgi:hypothetical protein